LNVLQRLVDSGSGGEALADAKIPNEFLFACGSRQHFDDVAVGSECWFMIEDSQSEFENLYATPEEVDSRQRKK
jgi:hypothetical protein